MRDKSYRPEIDPIAREARLRRGREALARVDELREKIRRGTGPQPSSVELIREMREARARRFD